MRKEIKMLLLLLAVCFVLSPKVVMAAETDSQNGVTASISTEKDEYTSGEEIQVKVTVTNNNAEPVKDIKVQNILPDNLTVKEGQSLVNTIETLAAGESKEITITAVCTKGGAGDNNKPQDDNKSQDDSKPQDVSAKNGKTAKTTAKTGDSASVSLLLGMAGVSALAILAIVLWRKKKGFKSFLSLLLCVVLAQTAIMPAMTAEAAEQKISIDKKIKVDGAECTLKANVTYNLSDSEPGGEDDTVTRGEWIDLLLTKLEYPVYDESDIIYYYADTEGTEYGLAVESAVQQGIIPLADEQDVPEFHQDEAATREFVAVTAVNALGYTGRDTQTNFCEDIGQLAYPMQDEIAVSEGLLGLSNGLFDPDRAIVKSEIEALFEAVDRINESSQMGDDLYEDIVYADGVLVDELKDIEYTLTENEDGTYTVVLPNNDVTKQIEKDTAFVLPESEQSSSIALIANSVSELSEGKLQIIARAPEDPSQIMSSLKFEGRGVEVDEENVEALVDDVEFSYDKGGMQRKTRIGGSVSIPGKVTVDFGEGKKINDHLKLCGKMEVSIPDVTARVDIDFRWFDTKVNEAALSISEKVEVSGGVEAKIESGTDITHGSGTVERAGGIVEIGRVPIKFGVPGMSADIIFGYAYSATGEIKVVYSLSATQGFEYKNGNFRNLCRADHDFQPVNINGSGKLGGTIGINLCVLKTVDVVGFDAQMGPAATAALEPHTTADPFLLCVDASIYLYSSWEMNPDTVVASFLKNVCHYVISGDIWDSDSSPLKLLDLHFENGQKVDECTYGKGGITGYVSSATDGNPISGARVIVNKYDNKTSTVYTDANGKYKVENLSVGTYTLKVSANGYQTYVIDNVDVRKGAVTNVEKIRMISRDGTGQCVAMGSFIDAVTGDFINNVKYEVRKGWNSLNGELVEEGTVDKNYNVTLAPGNYTIVASADGYITNSENITATEETTFEQNVTLSPSGTQTGENEMRIVLTWGSEPSDLDSHLFGTTADSAGTFHTYYSNKSYYYNGEEIAELDLDDTTSYGPETTTVKKINPSGTYSYYVHDYTNRSSSSSDILSNSEAKVRVYKGQRLILSMNVPVNEGGTVWHVFDYDAATDTITPSDQMTYSSDPGTLGRAAAYSTDGQTMSEEEAIRIISECEEK